MDRDILIAILRQAHPGFTPTIGMTSDAILDTLRCDKCKHWDEDANWCYKEVKFDSKEPKPEQFCSSWESK